MYIVPTRPGYVGTEQVVRRAPFLLVVQRDVRFPKPHGPVPGLRAFVRKVALHQFGHWMMGRANIGGKWLSVSGSYGADGLPKTVDPAIWEKGVPLPPEVEAAFWAGDGWNSSGSEGPALRQWALSAFKVTP